MYKTLCIHRKNGTIRHIGVQAENKRDLRKKAAGILEITCLGAKITTLDGEVWLRWRMTLGPVCKIPNP